MNEKFFDTDEDILSKVRKTKGEDYVTKKVIKLQDEFTKRFDGVQKENELGQVRNVPVNELGSNTDRGCDKQKFQQVLCPNLEVAGLPRSEEIMDDMFDFYVPSKVMKKISMVQKRLSFFIEDLDNTCDAVNDTFWTKTAVENLLKNAEVIQEKFEGGSELAALLGDLQKEKSTPEVKLQNVKQWKLECCMKIDATKARVNKKLKDKIYKKVLVLE